MGTSTAGHSSPAEVEELEATRARFSMTSSVAPPGSVPVTSMVLLDPVHTFIQGDLSLPPNIVGKVMVLGARDELRGEFKLAGYRNDARVLFTEMAGNHTGIGGGYDLDGTGAVALEASTAYFQTSGVGPGDIADGQAWPVPAHLSAYRH